MARKESLKVIIVGGGIGGLTLANALERVDIDYVLLERRNEFAPQVGASIGIMSNGARILDQLGIFKELEKNMEPLHWNTDKFDNGQLMFPATDLPQFMEKRFFNCSTRFGLR
jgi:2-polyprenyl-6-methoxyphenol hydroxylase-like FAD-dependent oxidoreductase